MAGESERWETWGGYVKLGGAIAAVAAAGVGSWQLNRHEPSSPAAYDLRVEQAARDIQQLETEARSITARIQVNAEDIARLKAEMAALHELAGERERRFLMVETESKRLGERQEHILDRLREVEQKRGR